MFNKKNTTIAVVLTLVVVGVIIASQRLSNRGSSGLTGPTFEVERGPLTISVIESGTIQARDRHVIRNEVEGRTSIIYLVAEGTHVQEGDLLVELDASDLEDRAQDLEIRVQNAEADLIRSQENYAITESQTESDVELAELDYEFAKQDYQQYIDGEYPYELKQRESDITLAEEEYARALQNMEWSEKLYEENYISQTEFQGDQLQSKRRELDLELARGRLDLLTEFTYTRKLAQLESDMNQAKSSLERTRRRARADMIQAEAELKAREAEYNNQKRRYDHVQDQIKKTKIYAPADGMVIHATSTQGGGRRGTQEPLEAGHEVREREELIHLPAGQRMRAELNVHESNLDKISAEMPVEITIDAMPDVTYYGKVTSIAPLPDPTSMWLNPDLKVYRTDVEIEGSAARLRPGMNCRAEIIVKEYDDAVYVPIQAVVRVGGRPTVFLHQGDEFVPHPVEIGLDNNRMVHITEGLEEGQHVLLSPPLDVSAVVRRPREVEEESTDIPMQPSTTDESDAPQSGQDQPRRQRQDGAQRQGGQGGGQGSRRPVE